MLASPLPVPALLDAIFTFFNLIATLVYMPGLSGYYEMQLRTLLLMPFTQPVYGRPIGHIYSIAHQH